MKELSTVEKAKRYDEAKLRMSAAYNSNRCTIGFMNEIFPELRESEDDRIRKALIKYFTLSDDNADYQCCGVHCKDIVAWFEKQGNKTEPIEDFDTEFERQISHLVASAINREHEYNKGYIKWVAQSLIEYAKREIEKQGEQKSIKEHNVCDFCEDRYGCVNPCPMKLTDEQKPVTDFSDLRTWKYIVDAVLTEKEGIGQYLDSPVTEEVAKKLQKRFGKIEQKPAEWHREDEQNLNACLGYIPDEFLRRWLMDVIHAKYDKPADKIEPNFKVGDTIIKKHNSDILYFGSFTITDITGGKYWYNDRIICDITEQDEWEIYEPVSQKSAEWSEEDDTSLVRALAFIRNTSLKDVDEIKESVLTWITSLKDRVQPKQEWSEDDKNRINRLIAYFEDKESFTAEDDIVYANWLKSLKERYTWKPSKEQMKALKIACDEHWEPDGLDPLYTLWEQLNKLK